MHNSFVTLVFFILLSSLSSETRAQAPGSKPQSRTSITNSNGAAPWSMSTSPDRSSEVKKLCDEGEKLVEAEQFSKAQEKFQQALKIDNEYADAYAGLGRMYFEMKQWQKAVDNLTRAAELRTKQAKPLDQFSFSPAEEEVASNRYRPAVDSPASKLPKDNPRSIESNRQTNAPANSPTKTLPKTGNNTADVKTLRPESKAKQPEEMRQVANSTSTSANKQLLTPNSAPVKAPVKESETPLLSVPVRPTPNASANSQVKLPKATNSTTNMGKAAPSPSFDLKLSTPSKGVQETNGKSASETPPAEKKQQPEPPANVTNNSTAKSLIKLSSDPNTGSPARSETKQSANQNAANTNSTASAQIKQTQLPNTNADFKTTGQSTGLPPVPRDETRTVEKNADLNS